MRSIAAIACVVLIALSGAALAAVEGVDVKLSGGDVKGKVRGAGRASVSATVTNNTERALSGIRIGAFYSATDQLPGEGAKWRVHEFVFEPPLLPGKSTVLRFSDENALEYVKLEAQRVQYALGLSYGGRTAKLSQAVLERDGVVYAGTRDLFNLIGGSISYEQKTYMLVFVREGKTVKVKPGQKTAELDGKSVPLAHPVLEVEGKSMLPVEDFVALFGLKASRDDAAGMLNIE